ncbi:hypothetical protein ACOSZF_19370 [Cytobacillus firmus]|uniref:hypothetical protein n=2 Tax=Cytobacillus firmus TaxID=1399 RepID=UPI00157FE7A6|nr:hypothetical protein [Cytobacillus firmus]MBG9549604.1 hypothetical protein [Cytobacillus firmus]MBG9605072.1 hypothetical protein [Cytobacillus firmus]MBG9655363.1 hypothetical protein [Cytobacillus firmus]MED1908107.1 hypothetical protein [Cytobacillus firmus]MED1942328.1 hypothetical protein [Cytobacillus firmus]
MGYILPVTSYQYNQYAEREIGTKYDPFRFVPVARISAQSNEKAFRHELPLDIHGRSTKSNTQERAESQTRTTRKKAEETYRELTGKGRFISECI